MGYAIGLRIFQARENGSQVVDDFIWRERFAQKSGDPGVHQTIESIALNKSSAENDWNVGANFAKPLECFLAVHERHGQVEQDQLKRVRLPAEKIESFKS